ncbi:hypothetical protein RND71_035398 [Anisodus tanguticus]|uniref:Putative plant transposon protein domain-containing protein n=1 Tax=Anisodus tanguticus TaxID=243964 RepID=A0AAE1R705_9SOLA|nr:hypothetical protein RND71_035398 [Anisodus tanguticus]
MRFPKVSSIEYDKLLRRFDYKAIRHKLCGENSLAVWVYDNGGCHKHMCRSDFKLEAKVVLRFINCHIMPSAHDSTVSKEKVCLIYALLTRMPINTGRDMENEKSRKRETVFPMHTD